MKRLVCYVILGVILLSRCTLLDSDKPIISNIKVETAQLTGSNGVQLPSEIKDVWAYVDDQLIGIYPLPSTIPVIISGTNVTAKITLKAGIKPNGQNGNSEEYPFFDPYIINVSLKEGDTQVINPRYTYRKDLVFDFIEDFEAGNIFTEDIDGNANTKIVRLSGKGVKGTTAGSISLSKGNTSCETTHFASFSNKNNKLGKVYLELDYKTEEDFFVGTITKSKNQLTKSFDLAIVKSSEWKRIYVDLTPKISNVNVENYQIVVASLLNEQQRSNAELLLDNIRLVHF